MYGGVQMTDDQIEKKVRSSLAASAKDIGKAIGENVNLNGGNKAVPVPPAGKYSEGTTK
jgi:hypothetical protein